jgi:uncharacterized membrane protein YeaQ/YmgE (transglycosylase-associated protein family)
MEAIIQVLEWVVLGLVAGFIASKIVNKTGSGLLMDVVLGVLGALVGGFIVRRIPAMPDMFKTGGFNIPTLIVATLGAILLMLVFHFLFRRRSA